MCDYSEAVMQIPFLLQKKKYKKYKSLNYLIYRRGRIWLMF